MMTQQMCSVGDALGALVSPYLNPPTVQTCFIFRGLVYTKCKLFTQGKTARNLHQLGSVFGQSLFWYNKIMGDEEVFNFHVRETRSANYA